jgi:2-keto-4-pentenoate hydratase/2-oxohepta-3-ene-1,7-dioic acid hydratase in catechol pathway
MSIAPTLDDFIRMGQPALDDLSAAARPGMAAAYHMSEIHVQAPVKHPSKIIAIGQNYMDHCRECNVPPPTRPVVFTKFPSSIIGPTHDIQWRSDLTEQVDWEVELGVIIGQTTRHVPEEDALDYVFGYTVINDVSARDLQSGDGQWVRGKSLDTFCPMGPVIVTADEIPDPQNLGIRCWVNGAVMQDSNTLEMIFNVRYLIAFLSRAFTLNPGDVISTGTPHGIGAGRDPQIFLHDGDVVEVEVDQIGRLRNVCRVQS